LSGGNIGYLNVLTDLNVMGNFYLNSLLVDFGAITGVMPGTAEANKALITNETNDISNINILSSNIISTTSRIETQNTSTTLITSSSNCDNYGLHLHSVLASSNGIYPGTSIAFNNMAFNWPNGYSFIQFAKTAANANFTRVLPYGSAVGADTKTNSYATTPAVREAAMILATDIFQARQVSQTGGVSIDGFSPSPYRMGNSMIGKIRGLISGYTNPNTMVG